MIEVAAVFLQLIIFLLVFSFPFNPVILNKILDSKIYFIGIFDTLLINAVVILNFLIIASFLNLESRYVFYILIITSIFFNIFSFKKWFEYLASESLFIIFFLILCICIFFSLSNSLKFEWDGIAHWFFKTKLFYDGHAIENIKDLPAPMYPHLGTYLWAFFWKNSILEYEYLGRLIYPFIYILSIFSICCSVSNNKNFNKLLLLPIILFMVILTYDEYLFGGYQEYLLFSLIALMSKLILNMIDNNLPSFKQLFILIFTGNLLIYCKDEGLIYLVIIFLIFQFFLKANLNKIVIIFSLIISISIQFYLEKNIIKVYGFQEPIKFDFNTILNVKFLIINSILILKYILISFLKYPLWIIIFVSTYILVKENYSKKKISLLFLLISAIFSFYFLLYTIHPSSSEFLMKVTLDRLIFQTSGFFMIYTLTSFVMIYSKFNNYVKK